MKKSDYKLSQEENSSVLEGLNQAVSLSRDREHMLLLARRLLLVFPGKLRRV